MEHIEAGGVLRNPLAVFSLGLSDFVCKMGRPSPCPIKWLGDPVSPTPTT